jgi:hypothetical protein
MSKENEVLQHYLHDTIEFLLDYALEAKSERERNRGTEKQAFWDGYLLAFHRVISLFQQQANAFGIPLEDIGLSKVDPDHDLV